jgi:hypothetical protein
MEAENQNSKRKAESGNGNLPAIRRKQRVESRQQTAESGQQKAGTERPIRSQFGEQ